MAGWLWPGRQPESALPRQVQREIADVLVSHTALTQLTGQHAQDVARRMRLREARPGAILVRESSTDNHFMLVVLEGEARIEQAHSSPDDSQVMGIVGRGAILGEQGLIDASARSATVTALGPMRLAVLEKDAFQQLVQESPLAACGLMGAIIETLSARLREANRRVRVLSKLNRVMQEPQPERPATPPVAVAAPRPAPPRQPAVPVARVQPVPQPQAVHAATPRPPAAGSAGRYNIPIV